VKLRSVDDALTRFQKVEIRQGLRFELFSMDCIVTIKSLLVRVMGVLIQPPRYFWCLKKQVEGKSFMVIFIFEDDRQKIF